MTNKDTYMKTMLWTEHPIVLIESPTEFMYSEKFDKVRNLNAMVRFTIYWSIIIFLLTGQPIVFVILVVALILMRRPVVIEEPILTEDATADAKIYCQSPSVNNPLANPTPADWGNGKPKLPACPTDNVKSDIRDALNSQPITGPIYAAAGEDANSKLARRSFYSIPTSGVPDGRDEFMRGLYGDNIGRPFETAVQLAGTGGSGFVNTN
jgi:hypothetical protein